MKTQTRSKVPAAASFLALLLTGAPASGFAQAPTPPSGKLPEHHEAMRGKKGMSDMMGAWHHVLAMAYRDNLATFARALQGHATHSKTVNLDLARPAVAEMRRSFDQLQQHHQAQVTMMGDSTKPGMSGNMQHMGTHLTALGEHLTSLESEVNAATPDPEKISGHTTEILKQCAGMSAMPAKAKAHPME